MLLKIDEQKLILSDGELNSVGYQLDHVNLEYKDGKQTKFALKDISIGLPKTGLVIIFGPSGSGKTSLLYLLSGIKKPTRGNIMLDGKKLEMTPQERKKTIGFIFQSSFLINYLNVLENVAVGFDDKDVVESTLKNLDILDLKHRMPYELSGGQKQRVAIARSLVNNPSIILADEPTASLDHVTAQKVVDILKEISLTKLVVLVTHDNFLLQKADRVIELWDGGAYTP